MAYRQSPINFGEGTGSDKGYTGMTKEDLARYEMGKLIDEHNAKQVGKLSTEDYYSKSRQLGRFAGYDDLVRMSDETIKPGQVDQSAQDATAGGSSSKGEEGGQEVDWPKVDTGRRQRAAETAEHGMTDRESRKFQRQQRRATRKMQRQQRRDARKLKRRIRRRNEGGFFRRLFS